MGIDLSAHWPLSFLRESLEFRDSICSFRIRVEGQFKIHGQSLPESCSSCEMFQVFPLLVIALGPP